MFRMVSTKNEAVRGLDSFEVNDGVVCICQWLYGGEPIFLVFRNLRLMGSVDRLVV